MKDKITGILISVLKETMEINGLPETKSVSEKTPLIGKSGILDSLAFVVFLVAVEQKINSGFNKCISLNNEKAFSRSNSPFRSLGALRDYILEDLK